MLFDFLPHIYLANKLSQRIIKAKFAELIAQMTEPIESSQIPIPKSERGRGRPPKIRSSEVYGRAENWRDILDQVWDQLWPLLSNAHSEEEVTKAFQDGARPYDQTFVPSLSALTLQVLQESTLPKRRKPLQRFLADSLAGVGVVTPRRSRDICAQERVKRLNTHRILRYEYYVECSCGYKGHSKKHACAECGAAILFPVNL
jgi:hypothetical protein